MGMECRSGLRAMMRDTNSKSEAYSPMKNRQFFASWLARLAATMIFAPLAVFPASASAPVTLGVIVSAALTAAVFYFCLFHLRAVRAYLDTKGIAT